MSVKYTEDHEWVRPEGDGTLTIGITMHAQEQLGDIVFVELPEVGRQIAAGEEAVVIESVKAAADIRMPVTGEVVSVNTALNDAPETVNADPMGEGWFLKIRPEAGDALDHLLDQAAYDRLVGA
jgi:glycine cleavage system H protein